MPAAMAEDMTDREVPAELAWGKLRVEIPLSERLSTDGSVPTTP